jgi:manganese efflux pump family protein
MMDWLTVLLLALGMSFDDFALAICISLANPLPTTEKRVWFASKMAIAFSISTLILPLIGWLLGLAVYKWLVSFSPWIILVVFCGVGIWIIKEAFENEKQNLQGRNLQSFWILLLLGTLGSFDEGAVGLGYAFLKTPVAVIILAVLIINTLFVVIASLLSNKVPESYQKVSRIAAGSILILLGILKSIEILIQ